MCLLWGLACAGHLQLALQSRVATVIYRMGISLSCGSGAGTRGTRTLSTPLSTRAVMPALAAVWRWEGQGKRMQQVRLCWLKSKLAQQQDRS